MRAVLSASDPARAWKLMRPRPLASPSSPTSRSFASENAASSRRPRTTRSLPVTTVSAASGPELATKQKCGRGRPSGVSSGKYRWWLCMTVMITRSGRSRNRSGNEPRSTLGHSARYTTSRMTPAGSAQPGCSASPCSIASRRAICIGHHEGAGQLALVRARVGQLDLAAEEAVAARRAPRADAAELDLDDVAAVQADEPADRAREAQLLAAPAHVLRERETLDETVDDLGQHLRGGSRIGVDLGEHEPVAAHERARRHVVPPREARAGGRRLAVGPEGHRLRRARGARDDRPPGPPARPLR